MKCVFCESSAAEEFLCGTRKYNYCNSCKGVSVLPSFFLDNNGQRSRYELHNNSLEQAGYRRFLEKFADKVIEQCGCMEKILDYGCGPEPCLIQLLEEYKECGKIDKNCIIDGWDPFFCSSPVGTEYDLIMCHETAEHFENPVESFVHMASLCKKGSVLAAATSLVPDIKAFDSWWYKEDTTHVSFYSMEGLKKCAQRAGFLFDTSSDERIFFFTKK